MRATDGREGCHAHQAGMQAARRGVAPGWPRWRAAIAGMAATSLLAALTACGGGNATETPGVANLDGTLDTCTIADGGTTCTGTVVWRTASVDDVTLSIDGTVASHAAAGTLSPTVTYGHPISIVLQAGDTTVGPKLVTARCSTTSFWNGSACAPAGGAFTITGLSVTDGETGVTATSFTGTSSNVLTGGTVSIACADSVDAAASLPVTATLVVEGLGFTVQPTFEAGARLPLAAQCTLSGTLTDTSYATATFGPVRFTTATGPTVQTLFVEGGAGALPWLVDPVTGTARTPPQMAAHVGQCFGRYDRHLGTIRTLCGKVNGGLAAVWDIDPVTAQATPIDSLDSVFANGNVAVPDVVIAADATQFMTRGGVQSDGTTNSSVVALQGTDHVDITWDWGGQVDYVVRLVLDDAAHRLYAVTHLGLVKTIDTTTLAVVATFDAATVVTDAVLDDGQVVMTADPGAGTANLVVFDPATQATLPVTPVSTGHAATAVTLSGADLVVATTDSTATPVLCRIDAATFLADGACRAQATASSTLAADATRLYGDQGKSVVSWPLADLATSSPLATFNGPVVRVVVVAN